MNEKNTHVSKVNWETLQTQVEVFSLQLHSALEELGILEECKNMPIDHICVRFKYNENINSLKGELEKFGQIIDAEVVNGREIFIIQLVQPLNLNSWKTYGVELPFPKSNHLYKDGWEHVEFVLGEATNTMDGVREAFIQKFSNLNIERLKTDYSYSENEPHADGDQMPNPTIGIKVNGVGLKFHANPIQAVVGFEK